MGAWNGSSGFGGIIKGTNPLALSDGTTFTSAQAVTLKVHYIGDNESYVVGDLLDFDGTATYAATKPKKHGR
jgi:hypothetical protein